MGSTAYIIWMIFFSSVGMSYMVYGRRQKLEIAFISGLILCIFPYFVTNIFLMILIGAACMALPFFIKF
ncbi:MAG: hypothetical protein Q7U10_09425 [Thermodesulfovibrionia bacterium]|nr:hypothetical protein [Thermodesulfovibrionia bacterium]